MALPDPRYSVRVDSDPTIEFGADRRRAIQTAQRLCRETESATDVLWDDKRFRSYVWDWTRKRVLRT